MTRAFLHAAYCSALLLFGQQLFAAPIIESVRHSPAIPRVNEPVQVSAKVTGSVPTATLRWRVDGAQFESTPMADADGDGVFQASIGGKGDLTVVEFFVDAVDSNGASTWPASSPGALWQVDATHSPSPWVPGTRSIYRAILRAADRTALVGSPAGLSFRGTLVTLDGTGELVRYGCEFRSAAATLPQSFTVTFPEPWNGRNSFAVQSRFPHAQSLGNAIFRRASLAFADAAPVRFRVNGADLAEAGSRMFGTYARLEPVDAAWPAPHFPSDAAGNLYRVDDHGPGTHGELAYETPATPGNYAETYHKLTNVAANDYSDIIALTDKLSNAPEATYRAELGTVLNLDQWLGYLALDALIGNVRDGLQNGRGDGFSLYRGLTDTRFILVPGEMDTIFGLGENGTGDAITRSIFSYENVSGLNRMMNHPDILPEYYAKLLALLDSTFTHAALDELIDQIAVGWVDAPTIQAMKDFITTRRANVSAQIPQVFSINITTGAPNVETYKTTTDGTATISGTFNVARVRSIRVNGQAAALYYRTNGPNDAGTWTYPIASGLNRGMNIVKAKFYSGGNGTGEVVHELQAELLYSGGAGTNVTGSIGTGAPQSLFSYGTGGTGSSGSVSGTPGSTWRVKHDLTTTTIGSFPATWKDEGFDDSSWIIRPGQTGYGNSDENQSFPRVDYDAGTAGTQNVPSYFFRSTFTIANLAQIGSISGQIKYDDAYRIYINGVKVLNSTNLPDTTAITAYATGTSADNATANITIPLGNLHDGVNTIAVEIHQGSAASGDVTFDLRLDAATIATPEVRWTLVGSPYRLTGDATVPAGVTLTVDPGVSVFADSTRRLTVSGIIKVLGNADAPVRFSHLPGAPLVDDPREPGTQSLPPKWGGILILDSLSAENVVSYADFVNAQPAAVEGCITVQRSECLIEHCSFRGTYLHGVYGRNCSLTVQDCLFPTVFPPGKEQLGEVLDNLSEFVEVDSPPNEVDNNPLFFEGFPIGGHLRLYRNFFGGSSGHNDLTDITAGKWGVTPVLDVQDNHFLGPTGDEHIDLNGDAYIAGNFFENVKKDIYTSDHGYANAVSSDVGGPDTTVVVVRNVFTHTDHAVNVKRGSGVIFEHNTVADVNADYYFERQEPPGPPFTQNVAGSAVNLFIPEDSGRAGDGAYAAFNLFFGREGGQPYTRVFSWADLDLTGQPAKTTKIEMAYNFLDPALSDPFIGSKHPDNVFAAVWQSRIGDPLFVDRASRNYALRPHSPARGSAPYGLDYGATISGGCYLGNVPPALTPSNAANIVVGGPGIFAYKWRLNGGEWSAAVEIAPGVFPRTGPTIRTATLALTALTEGSQTLEVVGQGFAGNWQSTPTVASWTVNSTLRRIVLNEIVADALNLPDTIELHNAGAASVPLAGWFVTDDPAVPSKYALSGSIPAGAYFTFSIAGLDLSASGGTLQLREGAALVDSIAFGAQVNGLSIGRVGTAGAWTLCTPTPNAANVALVLASSEQLRFNEWLAAPGVRFETGWVEIANPTAAPVALAGVRIADESGDSYVFPPLSFIGAGGFLKLDATCDTGPGELPFLLSTQGGALHLSDNGLELDAVQFLPQTADVSMGRDAAGALAFYTMPTGGFSNTISEPKTYRAWLAWHATSDGADDDGDEFASFAEFALGLNPHRADGPVGTAANATGNLSIQFALPENAGVSQGHGMPEVTYVVQAIDSISSQSWLPVATKTPLGPWTGDVTLGVASSAYVPVTVRDVGPINAKVQRFMRLLMKWTP